MASYIKTLKEDNGDTTYPQTLASAVFTSGGSDVESEMSKYVTATDIASTSALTPPVQTNMIADEAVTTAKIADEAVTADKIDWSTIVAGTINVGSMAAGRQERTVSIPTQANTNYVVLLTLGGAMSGGWTSIELSVASKTTTSFTMVNYNEAGYAVNNVLINYLVIPQ